MKEFEEWWESQNIPPEIIPPHLEDALVDAFKAGMLAAADIAERMYFHHTPDDGVISGEGVADELRKRANDGA